MTTEIRRYRRKRRKARSPALKFHLVKESGRIIVVPGNDVFMSFIPAIEVLTSDLCNLESYTDTYNGNLALAILTESREEALKCIDKALRKIYEIGSR